MNADGYSDIRFSERFIFENSIYLLNMFEKKVDSFLVNRTQSSKERFKKDLLHPQNIIDPDDYIQDPPIKALSKDLTKPIWNCTTTTKPEALNVCESQQSNPKIKAINEAIYIFCERFKGEHEDQSNLQVKVKRLILDSAYEHEVSESQKSIILNYLQDILNVIVKISLRELQLIYKMQMEEGERHGCLKLYYQAMRDSIDGRREGSSQMLENLGNFVCIVSEKIKRVIQFTNGPTLIHYIPQIQLLPEFVNPVLLAVYTIIKNQVQKKKESNSFFSSEMQLNIEDQGEIIFDELESNSSASKVTFINLDGYDTEMNLKLAKHMTKYVQYISFPCEDTIQKQCKHYEHYYQSSQLFIKNYLYKELSSAQKEEEHKIFKFKEGKLLQNYKKLLVFPIHSHYLQKKHNISQCEYFGSFFVNLMMRELVYNEIKQFNPSVIIISYSNKLIIENEHFQAIIKELTILSSMKVIMYNNMSKVAMYDNPSRANNDKEENLDSVDRLYRVNKERYERSERSINLFNKDQINYSWLDKMAIFLKISSGTYNLDKKLEENNKSEQYSVYKMQKYIGKLLKIISRSHPTLEKYKNRASEYLKIERILWNVYKEEDVMDEIEVYKRYIELLQGDNKEINVQQINQLSLQVKESNFYNLPFYYLFLIRQAELLFANSNNNRCENIRAEIMYQYGGNIFEEQNWRGFVFKYKVELRRKLQEEDSKYLVRIPRKQHSQDHHQHSLLALQFCINQNNHLHNVKINKQSQVCISPTKNPKESPNTCVFYMNHLVDTMSTTLSNYYGIISDKVNSQLQYKVELKQLELSHPNIRLQPYQYLAKFNYTQTEKFCILFWPVIFDQVEELFSSFMHIKYQPTPTNLILIANKQDPSIFHSHSPVNQASLTIMPRTGCTSYQITNTNIIYIFGGYYCNQDNYLKFQNDITIMKLEEPSQLIMLNVDKKFHFDYKDVGCGWSQICELRNDTIRPKVQYEIYEMGREKESDDLRVLVLGGVGQKFHRPYSIIGYLAHVIIFSPSGQMLSIKRIRLNNVVPINLKNAVKTRFPAKLQVLQSAQNRKIYTQQSTIPINSQIYTHYSYKYCALQKKLTYTKQHEYGILSTRRQSKSQCSATIKGNDNVVITCKVYLRSNKMKETYLNYIDLVYEYYNVTLYSHQYKRQQLPLELQIDRELYQRMFINEKSNRVVIPSNHIVAIDSCGLEVYALLQHHAYTNNQYVIAYCDLSHSIQKIADEEQTAIYLRQIYRFDKPINNHVLKIISPRQIFIGHSVVLNNSVSYEEMILIKANKGYFIKHTVQPVIKKETITNVVRQISDEKKTSKSFYTKIKDGIMSLTFVSLKVGLNQQKFLLYIQELKIGHQKDHQNRPLQWECLNQKIVTFQSMLKFQKMFRSNVMQLMIEHERRCELIIEIDGEVHAGNFDLGNIGQTVNFRSLNMSIEGYYNSNTMQMNKQLCINLSKSNYKYEQQMQIMEVE